MIHETNFLKQAPKYETFDEFVSYWRAALEQEPFNLQARHVNDMLRDPKFYKELKEEIDKRAFKDHGAGI